MIEHMINVNLYAGLIQNHPAVDNNLELVALGTTNVIASLVRGVSFAQRFFFCFHYLLFIFCVLGSRNLFPLTHELFFVFTPPRFVTVLCLWYWCWVLSNITELQEWEQDANVRHAELCRHAVDGSHAAQHHSSES